MTIQPLPYNSIPRIENEVNGAVFFKYTRGGRQTSGKSTGRPVGAGNVAGVLTRNQVAYRARMKRGPIV